MGHSHERTVIVGNPIISGKEAELTVHVTGLKTFKPIKVDSLKLNVTVLGKSYAFTALNTGNDGIYRFNIQFDVNGKADASVQMLINGIKGFYRLGQFTIYHCEHDWAVSPEHSHVSITNKFTKEHAMAVDFTTEIVTPKPIGQVVKTTGKVLPVQADEVVPEAGIS